MLPFFCLHSYANKTQFLSQMQNLIENLLKLTECKYPEDTHINKHLTNVEHINCMPASIGNLHQFYNKLYQVGVLYNVYVLFLVGCT